MRILKHKPFLVAYLAIIIIISSTAKSWHVHKDYPYQFAYRTDVNQYYSYLPALFVHNDLSFSYYNERGYWLTPGETGINLPKMTAGMAIMYSPFFVIGHIVAKNTDYPSDGYSLPYSISNRIGTYIYVTIGLYLLYLSLLYFFKPWISAVTIFITYVGTNLLYYSVGEAEMTHSYLFFLFSFIVYQTLKWRETKKNKHLLFLSLIFGLSVLIRPTSIIVLLFPLITIVREVKFIDWIKNNWKVLILALILFLIPIFIQLLYWKVYGGSWIRWSYSDEGFFFGNPSPIKFLFSYRNGWLTYSPVMIFAVLGMFLLPKKLPELKWQIPIIIVLAVYILSSWWCWWFGGSLGSRAMVEFYVFLVFPLAAFIQFMVSKKYIVIPFFLIVAGLSFFSNLAMHKKTNHELHWDSMSKEAYWYTFSRIKLTAEEHKHLETLYKAPDYENAKKGLKERERPFD